MKLHFRQLAALVGAPVARSKFVRRGLAAGICVLSTFAVANAAPLATGTVSKVNIGQGEIGVYITAASGSPCASGWFYSWASDTDDTTVNRILATLLAASASGSTVTIFATTVTCTNGRFTVAEEDIGS